MAKEKTRPDQKAGKRARKFLCQIVQRIGLRGFINKDSRSVRIGTLERLRHLCTNAVDVFCQIPKAELRLQKNVVDTHVTDAIVLPCAPLLWPTGPHPKAWLHKVEVPGETEPRFLSWPHDRKMSVLYTMCKTILTYAALRILYVRLSRSESKIEWKPMPIAKRKAYLQSVIRKQSAFLPLVKTMSHLFHLRLRQV